VPLPVEDHQCLWDVEDVNVLLADPFHDPPSVDERDHVLIALTILEVGPVVPVDVEAAEEATVWAGAARLFLAEA